MERAVLAPPAFDFFHFRGVACGQPYRVPELDAVCCQIGRAACSPCSTQGCVWREFFHGFFSGITANTMLSEAHDKGTISDRELVLSNLFNSLPTYFLHLPTIFFIAAPFIGSAAAVYVGLTALAAILRTLAIVVSGKFLLPPFPRGVCRAVLMRWLKNVTKRPPCRKPGCGSGNDCPRFFT